MEDIRDDQPLMLTTRSAAARLDVSERTLKRWTAEGRIPRRMIGGRGYYSPGDLRIFVESVADTDDLTDDTTDTEETTSC